MSAEWPTKRSAPMTEPSADKANRNSIEKDHAERAGGSSNDDTDTSSKSKPSESDNYQKYIDVLDRSLQNPNLSDEGRASVQSRKLEHENKKQEIEDRTAENKSNESPTNPSDDYGQNHSNVQDSNPANNPKEATSDHQSKLDQLKSKHQNPEPDQSSELPASPSEDYGQNSSNLQDSNPANNLKEAASDPQSKLNQLKSEHLRDDYGQSGRQSDSTPTNSEPTDDIKS